METFKKAWVLTHEKDILWETLTTCKPMREGEYYPLGDDDNVMCYGRDCFVGIVGE